MIFFFFCSRYCIMMNLVGRQNLILQISTVTKYINELWESAFASKSLIFNPSSAIYPVHSHIRKIIASPKAHQNKETLLRKRKNILGTLAMEDLSLSQLLIFKRSSVAW